MPFVRGAIAAGVRNPVFANLLMACLLVGGYLAVTHLKRESYPQFSLDIIRVNVLYPGASPEDVEQAVCRPIEEVLVDIDGIDELTSSADPDIGSVWFTLTPDARDSAVILQEVKDRVDQITTFPPEVEKPVVTEEVIRHEVINIAVYGDVPERTLKQFAREVKNDLLAMPQISQVSLSGVREDEILVELSEEALRAYDLSFNQVMAVIARSSLDLPAGTIKTAGEELTLRVKGQRLRASDYERLVVIDRPDAMVRLGQIASVSEGFAETAIRGRFNGYPGVLITVFKAPQQDILQIAALARDYVVRQQAKLPERLKMSVWGDNSRDVEGRISMLLKNGLAGFALVFITLAVFLQLRLAFWVAVGIPLAFSGALIVMGMMGQTINMISLFALIMVSGIIVDDAIVVSENIHTRRRLGEAPATASIEGAYRVALPVLGSSLTTIIAFIPLLYVAGVMGKFIRVLPIVVIAAIVASALEAFGVLPSHLCTYRPPGAEARPSRPSRFRQSMEKGIDWVIAQVYRPVYRLALRYRLITLALAVACVLAIAGTIFSGRTAFVLYPKEDGNMLRARVRFPEGTPASVTAKTIEHLEQAALALNDDPNLRPAKPGRLVRQVYSIAGEWVDFLPIRGDHVCEVRIELMPARQRRINEEEIISRWRHHIGEIHDAVHFSLSRHQLQPVERPIEVRLLGDDLEELREAAERIADQLRRYEGVTDVYLDLVPGKRELRVNLRPAARALGLTLEDVATQLRQGFFGGEAVKLQRGGEEVVVRVRYPERERLSIADLENKVFRTVRGDEIPFREAVDVQWVRGYASILHEDTRRRVRVYADIDERRANSERICTDIETRYLPEVVAQYDNMSYVFGGTRAEAIQSVSSLLTGFKMALVVMYAVLAGLLRSYVQPLVIMATVPLGLIGVVLGHWFMGYDLTLMSLFGVVALAGVVVNDALVLLDYVNGLIREGKGLTQAVLTAGEARFRAVVLTSLTTVAGLTPLLAERSSQARMVIPMAVSLVFGIAFATVLTLLVVPALYLIVNDIRRAVRWLRYGGTYPAPELVEEAYRDRIMAEG
jgi:multidrug efflux pump subunit AcrB